MADFWVRPDHILDLVGATLPLASTVEIDASLHLRERELCANLSLVLLRRSGDYLTAIATDRYVVGMGRRGLSAADNEDAPPDGWRLAIGIGDAKRLLTFVRSYRRQRFPAIPFTRHGVFYQLGHEGELTLPADLEERTGGFPDAATLLLRMAARNGDPTGLFGLDPDRAGQFKAARRIFAQQPSDPILFRDSGDHSFSIQIGEDFLGVLMGFRPSADGWPKLNLDGWKELA